jgi:outer membrane protein assembly factor BamA
MFSANFARRTAATSRTRIGASTTRGHWIGRCKFFGGQRSFGRVLVRNASYYRLTHTIVLARQTQFGVIAPFAASTGLTEQQSVPLPERFFGGGADTLRAFPYNQAGPRDTGMRLVTGLASEPTSFPWWKRSLLQ